MILKVYEIDLSVTVSKFTFFFVGNKLFKGAIGSLLHLMNPASDK